MNKEISPAPYSKEALPKYEKLLNEETTGAQALLLLGLEPVKRDAPVPTLKKEDLVKNATDGIPADHKKRITDGSFNERDEYWKDILVSERMEKWRKGFNTFLDKYTKDQTKLTEQAFLKTIRLTIWMRLTQIGSTAPLCWEKGRVILNFSQDALLTPILTKWGK